MVTAYADVQAPPLVPYRYGLLPASTLITDPEAHWQLGVQYDTDSCANGGIWDSRCGDPFTVTLTRTANANEFQVIFAPPAGPYEASVDGGPFQPFSNGGTFVEVTNPFTIIVRETTNFHRTVTITGINPASPQGTVFSGTSSAAAGNPPKTALGLQTIYGDPFAVYAGIDCRIVGFTEPAARATRRLASVEQRLVEQHVWDSMLTIPAAQLATGSVTAVGLKAGIAALERALGDSYGGIPVIHAAEWLSVYLADRMQLVPDGPVLRTNLGTAWAFGRGYGTEAPDGTTPPAGELWIYGTGVPTIRRSEVFVPATTTSGATNLSINNAMVVAERAYVVTLDCPLWAVHIDLAGEEPA